MLLDHQYNCYLDLDVQLPKVIIDKYVFLLSTYIRYFFSILRQAFVRLDQSFVDFVAKS